MTEQQTERVIESEATGRAVGNRRPLPLMSLGVVFFTLLALASGVAIYSVVTNAAVRDEHTFHARFRDVSGLRKGADVQVAGVSVGHVESLHLADDGLVDVTFTVASSVPVTQASTAVVRYRDLLGRRLLEVQQGTPGAAPLAAGSTIPADRTRPALDLDQLYNGFSPLFEGLDATKLNALSSSLVQVLQGEGGDVEAILGQAAKLTDTIGDRDQVIGSLLTNLDRVLGTIETRTPQTNALVVRLRTLVSGLADDRAALGEALSGIGGATDDITRLVARSRPGIRADLREIEALSKVINADEPELDRLLRRVPGYEALVGRVGIYQSAFQFYLCGVQIRLHLPGAPPVLTAMTRSQEQRCQS
ncbi:MCE family protein [Nocardioides fonticola]|uniref:MCE family protein n=1 Tax=Nocardioides fonticola TaxID=450363 RepID=A0ABP7XG75_9ACTN